MMASAALIVAVVSWLFCSACGARPARGAAAVQRQPGSAISNGSDWKEIVMAAERTAWEEEKEGAWVALLAPNAVIVTGRGPAPGAFDVRFARGEFAELLAYQFSGHAFQERGGPYRMQLHQALVRKEERGDSRTLELTRVLDYDDCGGKGTLFEERSQVQYTLQRNRGTWQITEVRSWPLSIQLCDAKVRSFNDGELARLDAKIATLDDSLPHEKGQACFDALRYAESADWYEKAASSPKAEPRDWLRLGWSAAFAGQLQRAQKAFSEALRRDPTLPSPRLRTMPP